MPALAVAVATKTIYLQRGGSSPTSDTEILTRDASTILTRSGDTIIARTS
jgi:hypothetical protein